MVSLLNLRQSFLYCMSGIYLFAFASVYVQVPGLYGDNGILPVQSVLENVKSWTWNDLITQPSVLRLGPLIGLSAETSLELGCLLATLLSLAQLMFSSLRCWVVYFILWALYLSIYSVGQKFLWFQWDILLLEAGFLTLLVAPVTSRGSRVTDSLSMWLVRWLLFRLMFASGVVKLTSGCDTWWGLTATTYHYETQCIPTPFSWWFHHLPVWWHKLEVAAVFVIEIPVAFMFLLPVRSLRVFAFCCQVLLQLLIIISGNYNFFNLLTCVLCLSLLVPQDLHLPGALRMLKPIITASVLSLLSYYCIKYLGLNIKDSTIASSLKFNRSEFDSWLSWVMPKIVLVGAASLALEIFSALSRSVSRRGFLCKIYTSVSTSVLSAMACVLFAISLVPLNYLDASLRIPGVVKELHQIGEPFSVTSSYGLFRRMTGVGGRPEVIVEGSNSEKGPWLEYEFLYKPGNVSRTPPQVAPHQPRLDWQMWFAALGSYEHNPWFVSFVHRLLRNTPEVLNLIEKNPFQKKAPKFIRAHLYHYHFTPLDDSNNRDFWRRTHNYKGEYLFPVSLDHSGFIDYLKERKLYTFAEEKKDRVSQILNVIRSTINTLDGFQFCCALVFTVFLVNATRRLIGR